MDALMRAHCQMGYPQQDMPQKNRLNLPSATPKQQKENRFLWNEGRTSADADFFTLGYSGRRLEDLLLEFEACGITTLMDIRHNPVSMYRPELSKKNLRAALQSWGIEYLHLPELGVPRDIRAKAIASGTRDTIWEWYDRYIAEPYVSANLHTFLNSADHPVVMMCVEADPSECHRHRLFMALEAMGLCGYDL